MIICLAQNQPCWNNPHETLVKCERLIAEAAGRGASLICFPEQFATGWDPLSTDFVQDINGEIVSVLREYAKSYRIAVLGSFREAYTEKPRNTAVFINSDGLVSASYSKIHLFSPAGEDKIYESGDKLAVFECEGVKTGIAICYDLRFGELFRLYRDAGVHLVVVPAAWPAVRQDLFRLFTESRAAEFQMFISSINMTGATPVDEYRGGSLVADPDGKIVTMADRHEELLFCEIQPEKAETLRKKFPVAADERHGLYSSIRCLL